MVGCRSAGEGSTTSFARGGPIYVVNSVGPITSVPEFKTAVVEELQNLDEEVCTAGDFDDELNVDEIRVFTEEELVEKALQEGLEEGEHSKEVVQSSGGPNEKSSNDSSPSTETSGEQLMEIKSKRRLKRSNKRGRFFDRDCRATELEGSYLARVEGLAKLKKKQDEDKAAARLHSFNGSSNLAEGTNATSEKIQRMRALRFITSPLKVKSSATIEHVPVSYPEVVLCVEIYDYRLTSRKTQEFLVLGKQKLTELKDNIYCLTDQLMQSEGQRDPSGYFLIEDSFYNDLRNPSAIDYSKPILDWLRNCKTQAEEKWGNITSGQLMKKQKELLGNPTISNLPSMKSLNMHSTLFCDLQFRLGAGYLFCHQGDCKHIIVIRDMRLIHPEDNQNMAVYPICTFQIKLRFRKCNVCFVRGAKKVTVDDKWAQENPCYFCDNCYYLLHYNEDGSLLYNDFTVYDYFHE